METNINRGDKTMILEQDVVVMLERGGQLRFVNSGYWEISQRLLPQISIIISEEIVHNLEDRGLIVIKNNEAIPPFEVYT